MRSGHYRSEVRFLYSEANHVGTAWLFLWLGIVLLGLTGLVGAIWYRQRRFQRGIVTVPFALLILAVAIQELFLFVAAFKNELVPASDAFVVVSAAAGALAPALVVATASRRGRETFRESADRPRRIRELEALGAIARMSSQAGSVEQVGGAVLDAAVRVVDVEACILLLYDRERRILLGKAASGMPDDGWRTFEVPVSDAFNQSLLTRGKPIVVKDVKGERKLKMTLAQSIGAKSALVVPVRHEERPIGTLTFYALNEQRGFDDVTIALAELIANEAADVLERARLQEEVLEERERASRVLAHVGDGVFFVDRDGVIRLWNPAAAAITGLDALAVLGKTPADALPGWSTIEPLVPVATAPASAARYSEALPLELADGERWISISAVEFPAGRVYAFRDLTEERGLDRLKSDFVATVSHELRTPLAAVYGAAMTLRRADIELDDERRDRLLAVIASESDRLARIINEVLAASRLESGAFTLTLESCDPKALTEQVVDAARTHAPAGVTIELTLTSDLPAVAADPDMMRQVLTNLVENAVKYSPAGGCVHVALEGQEGRVRFAVRDEGLGIPLREQEKIFEKFYRLDPNLTRGVGGTGLGLYICRELIRRMGGRIWVASREQEGSTFFFELPLAQDALAAPASEADRVEAAS
jgi:two-component system, OmpR family, phosphate regulon sensor histidine kinase PhoR